MTRKKSNFGTVYLVGAGPGDPGLLTLRAKELLEKADAVFYDHLVHPDVLKLCPRAELHYVGKVGHADFVSQEEIEGQLQKAAEKFAGVVRLKGGDPFIFGRGGEEAEFLAGKGISFEIVPGVTSAVAVPAYAGIPLTHRSLASGVIFFTGHEDPLKASHEGEGTIEWPSGIQGKTLVGLMGVKNLRANLERLVRSGVDPRTPAALIEWGTYPRQRVVSGQVADLADSAEREGIQPPAITVIGEVVRLRATLNWFERRPLFGRRILLTRARDQMEEFARPLRAWGAEVLDVPTIEIRPTEDFSRADAAIRNLSSYEWILFTSVHGVDYFFQRFMSRTGDIRVLGPARLAAVGPATARRLEERGLRVERIGGEFSGKGLAEAFQEEEVRGRRLLFAGAEIGGEELAAGLKEKGGVLDVAPVYRAVPPEYSQEFWDGVGAAGDIDLVVFTSPSSVKNLVRLVQGKPVESKIRGIPAMAIGPVTRRAVEESGFQLIGVAAQATLESLLIEILSRYGH
jgi:uroporphyrinogen III methyltransferase/synthase